MKCGVYIRVSTVGQKDNYSVPVQRQRGLDFCKTQNFEPAIYEEQASAASLYREQFQKLLKAIEADRIGAVWVIEFSRLSRDEEDAIFLRKLLVKHKVRLFIDGQETDLTRPESIFMYGINSVVSSYERARTIERIGRGVRKRIDEGSLKYGSILGYDYVFEVDGTKKVVVNEKEARTVQKMFEWYEKGLSYTAIIKQLGKEGLRTKNGAEWWASALCSVLHQPAYAGLIKNTKKELIQSKVYPPIVDPELWHRVQRLIAKNNTEKVTPMFRRGKHELSNIIKCGVCGSPFYYRHNKKLMKGGRVLWKRFYTHMTQTEKGKVCTQRPKYLNKAKTDGLIHALYVDCFTDKAEIKKFLEFQKKEVLDKRAQLDSSLASLRERQAEVEKQRQRLIGLVQQGMATASDIAEKMDKLNKEREKLETNYQEVIESLKLQEMNVDDLINDFKATEGSWSFYELNEVQRRELFKRRMKRCEFKNTILTVEWITGKVDRIDTKKIPRDLLARMETVQDILEGMEKK